MFLELLWEEKRKEKRREFLMNNISTQVVNNTQMTLHLTLLSCVGRVRQLMHKGAITHVVPTLMISGRASEL